MYQDDKEKDDSRRSSVATEKDDSSRRTSVDSSIKDDSRRASIADKLQKKVCFCVYEMYSLKIFSFHYFIYSKPNECCCW